MEITTHFTNTDIAKTLASEPVFNTTSDTNPNQATLANHFNRTTADSYLNQTNSTFDEATVSIPTLSGLTYTLFGITCCFTVLGLCGNSLILASMFKFRGKSKGHGALITSLSVCDSVALISTAFIQPCVHSVFGMDIRAITTIGCKVSRAVLFPAMFSSSAIVVLICLERFLAVWFPLKTRSLLSEKNIFRAILVCVTPIVLIYVATSVLYCEIKDGVCHPNFDGSEYSTVLKKMPNTTFYSTMTGFILVTTILILSILTPLTIVKLYKQMVIRRQLTTSELKDTHFQTSVKLIAVVLAHATLLGLPGMVTIAFSMIGITPDDDTLSGLTLPTLLNHSINFLLYNIFDADFRRNVSTLFGLTKKDKKPKIVLGSMKGASTHH